MFVFKLLLNQSLHSTAALFTIIFHKVATIIKAVDNQNTSINDQNYRFCEI
jgi:hypothetical protein